MVTINIIDKISKDSLPDWINYYPDSLYFNLFVNDKKCYLVWRGVNSCMLYVDGLKDPGWDINNAIYDNDTSEALFHTNLFVLDKLLDKAVEEWKTKQRYIKAGLTDDQATTAARI